MQPPHQSASFRTSSRAPARPRRRALALAAALACTLTTVGSACVDGRAGASASASLASEFDAARAWKHLEHCAAIGARPAGSEALELKRAYIQRELEASQLSVLREEFDAETPVGPLRMANLYADITARKGAAAPLVILCTHIDTKRLPHAFEGANDSASGTAALLELARVLARSPSAEITYRVLFLDGEESQREEWIDPDNRYGSRHHAAQLETRGELARTGAVVLLDMIGDRDLKLHTETYSDGRLLEIFFASARAQGLGQHVGGPRLEVQDDHLSFMAAGIPSVDLIDFSYGPNNAWWHTAEDRVEHCAPESLGAIGRIVLGGLPELERWVLARR